MSEPIGNSEQLPVAWFHEDDFSKGVSLHKDNFVNAIPLYTHPMRELTDEEIKDELEIFIFNGDSEFDIWGWTKLILKKASEK